MEIFKIGNGIEIVCRSERTRNGFRHLATLLINGVEKENGKCCYINRTWERYEFQSVLYNVVEKAFKNKIISGQEKSVCDAFIEDGKQAKEELEKEFGTISTIASLGNVFCNTEKEKNDWKLRMLKAGLEKQGLDIPNDWDTLSEKEKTRRLDNVIGFMQQKEAD
jgi:hypothetical protein